MKGDFSRDTFRLEKHFTRVMLQQGRVLLDADWNEQVSILSEQQRSLAVDLIGPHGGPAANLGFVIALEQGGLEARDHETAAALTPSDRDFFIGSGHYYVDGILVVNDRPRLFSDQPYLRRDDDPCATCPQPGSVQLAYLEVWERLVTALEDPDIAEVALLGPDTAARAQLVWQVRVLDVGNPWRGRRSPSATHATNDTTKAEAERLLNERARKDLPRLKARAMHPEVEDEPCPARPDARYRGLENQLYRVEIHRGGRTGRDGATFKWSADNASVVLPIRRIENRGDGTTVVTLSHFGRDARALPRLGEWVELSDDVHALAGRADKLLRVVDIDVQGRTVTLEGAPTYPVDPKRHALLRGWDQREAKRGSAIVSADGVEIIEETWIPLEDGVEIWFAKGAEYVTGDYWQIPARTATGDVEWPGAPEAPEERPPQGILRHRAPLAFIRDSKVVVDVRRRFDYLAR